MYGAGVLIGPSLLLNTNAVLHTLSMLPSSIHSSSLLPPMGVSDDAAQKREPSESTSSLESLWASLEGSVNSAYSSEPTHAPGMLVPTWRTGEGARWAERSAGGSSTLARAVGGVEDLETWISWSLGREAGVRVDVGGRMELGERVKGHKVDGEVEDMEMSRVDGGEVKGSTGNSKVEGGRGIAQEGRSVVGQGVARQGGHDIEQ